MNAPTILVVDDEAFPRQFLSMVLKPTGALVLEASRTVQADALLREHAVDVIFLDIRMPGEDGLAWLERNAAVVGDGQGPDVVVITGHGTISTAVQAMKLGAADFLEKPFESPEAVKLVVERMMGRRRLSQENRLLRSMLRQSMGTLIGQSSPMQTLYQIVERIAPLPITALILGESGTGKELVARTIHERSERSDKPFVAVNCAGMPEGLLESLLFGHEKGAFTGADRTRKGYFEEAQGGTLFLDEIGDMPLSAQSRLLRVLQERRFNRVGGTRELEADVRILAATHQDLPLLAEEGVFRQDLYYRLKVVEVAVPPLRARGQDVVFLAQHFLKAAAERFGRGEMAMSPAFEQALLMRRWPGNVRELKNTIESMAALATEPVLNPAQLPAQDQNVSVGEGRGGWRAVSLEQAREAFEQAYLTGLMAHAGGNVSKAAGVAGVARQHLHRKLKRHDIRPADFK